MVQYGPTVTDLVNFADCFGTCYCTSSSCKGSHRDRDMLCGGNAQSRRGI